MTARRASVIGLSRFACPPSVNVLLAVCCALPAAFCPAVRDAAAQERPASDFPAVINTQPKGAAPPSPTEAAALMSAPDGFQVHLFAGEPEVSQPISMTLDDRGRLWVVECYTYAENGYDQRFRDRIVIFEDVDGDAKHDKRTVFWDQGLRTTSAIVGHSGVWILNDGKLQRLTDEDQDDKADGEPITLLEGFAKDRAQHNIVNGLFWGPDGWLYGRHGITANSTVGRPTDGPGQRTELNCSIWRFHPARHDFQVVTNGTTNPWGLDFNDRGELFFTNNVIGHLWHVVPGAHYKRMFGEDFNPHLYELIDQTADHYHWDNSARWTDSRDGKGVHGELGGGHSHCGGLIYFGDRWPAEYQNRMLMCNTHGRRVNQNKLERSGCGYVGKRAPDFVMANNPWFRGVDLKCGPDGDVYLSDWTDLGECHDNDGVHRTSGRVYKITYGDPLPRPALLDRPLATRTNLELVDLLGHKNGWFARRARRLLQERHVAGVDLADAMEELRDQIGETKDTRLRLRLIWTLHACDALDEAGLIALSKHADASVRCWAFRLMGDNPHSPLTSAMAERMAEAAATETDGLVRLHLASSLQKIGSANDPESLAARWPLALALAKRTEDASDPVQPLMVWYGIEPAVLAHTKQALDLLAATQWSSLRRHISRRICGELESRPAAVDAMLRRNANGAAPLQEDVLQGMTAALRGWRRAKAPAEWTAFRRSIEGGSAEKLAQELAVVFGDGREMAHLREVMLESKRETAERRNALRVLLESQPKGLARDLHRLLGDRSMNDLAVAGLARYDHPDTAKQILNRYRQLRPQARAMAISTLASRKEYAVALLKALEAGRIPRADVGAAEARQMAALGDERVDRLLASAWGVVRSTPEDKRQQLAELKSRYEDPQLIRRGDARRGRQLFQKHCSSCHRLFGEGKSVGPDLTGGNRDSLDYLLENMVDPNAAVPAAYRISVLRLDDGRVLNGVVVRDTGPVLVVQTDKAEITIRKDEIRQRKQSQLSLMPDNLLNVISDDDLTHLLSYLQRRSAMTKQNDK